MLSLLLTLLVTPVAYSIFDDAAALKPFRVVSERLGKLGAIFGRRPKPTREREGEAGD
jgi:hypothetical protein